MEFCKLCGIPWIALMFNVSEERHEISIHWMVSNYELLFVHTSSPPPPQLLFKCICLFLCLSVRLFPNQEGRCTGFLVWPVLVGQDAPFPWYPRRKFQPSSSRWRKSSTLLTHTEGQRSRRACLQRSLVVEQSYTSYELFTLPPPPLIPLPSQWNLEAP